MKKSISYSVAFAAMFYTQFANANLPMCEKPTIFFPGSDLPNIQWDLTAQGGPIGGTLFGQRDTGGKLTCGNNIQVRGTWSVLADRNIAYMLVSFTGDTGNCGVQVFKGIWNIATASSTPINYFGNGTIGPFPPLFKGGNCPIDLFPLPPIFEIPVQFPIPSP